MAETQVDVKFGGDSGEAQKAISDVSKALKDGVGSMNDSLKSVMDGFGHFKGVLVGFTAVLAGGAAFKSSVSAANEWNGEVNKLAKTMGSTTEEASVMAVALNHIGVSTDTVAGASMMLSRQMQGNEQAFKTLGVATKDAETGAFRPVGDVMKDVNEKLKGIHNTTQQNVAGMQVYGRGWGELKGILKLNDAAMQEAAQKAKDLHLIVGPEGAAATKKYKEEQNDLKLIAKSLEIQIGNALLPTLVELGKWLGEVGPILCKYFTVALETIVSMVKTTVGVITMLSNAVKAVGAYAIMDDAPEVAEGMLKDITASNEKAASDIVKAWQPVKEVKKSAGVSTADEGPALDFSKEKKGGKGADKDNRLQEWKNQLEMMKESEGSFFKDSKQTEEKFWTEKLAEVQGNGEKEKAIRRSIEHELFNIHKATALQNRQLDDEDIASKRNAATYEVEVRRESLQTQLDLGQISNQQKLAGDSKLAVEQYKIEREAINSKILLYQEDVVAVSKFQEQKMELERKHALNLQKINNDILKQQKANIDQMLSPITSAISTSVQGIIQGTTTMQKALQNIWQSILASFISMIADMVKKWAVGELARTALSKQQSGLRTLLAKVGLIETTAASVTADATTTASTVVAEDTKLVATAPVAAAKGAESVASIPYVGPALAAAAFAAIMAMILGSRGHAVGSWDVPGDMVTKIHKGEMIVPAEFAQNVREGGGIGGGGGAVHVHVNAVDGDSVRRLFRDHAPVIAESIRRHARNFTPLGA